MIYTFDSSQVGAPVLSGSAGALRAVIKACLVDGFGAGPVASITVAAGVATVAFSGSHPYRVGSVIQIAGATPSALNGNKRTSTVVGSSITFPAPGIRIYGGTCLAFVNVGSATLALSNATVTVVERP